MDFNNHKIKVIHILWGESLMSERFKEINNAEVGKRIRDLREKRDITREKLGELLEIFR